MKHLNLTFRLVITAAALFPGTSFAQNFSASHGDFFRLLEPDKSELNLRYMYAPDQDEDSGSASFDLNNFIVNFDAPLPISEDSYFRFGANYEARMYDFEGVDGPVVSAGSETLHKITVEPGFGHFFNPDLLLVGGAEIGTYTDFSDSFDSDSFALYGGGQLVYRINPGAQLIVGVNADQTFEDTDVYPIIGFRLLSSDAKLHLNLTFPLEAELRYNLSPKWAVYAGGWISGDRYRVDFGEKFDVKTRDQRIGVGVVFWAGQHFHIDVEGGFSLGSELEFKTNETDHFDGDLDNAGYLSLACGFAL